MTVVSRSLPPKNPGLFPAPLSDQKLSLLSSASSCGCTTMDGAMALLLTFWVFFCLSIFCCNSLVFSAGCLNRLDAGQLGQRQQNPLTAKTFEKKCSSFILTTSDSLQVSHFHLTPPVSEWPNTELRLVDCLDSSATELDHAPEWPKSPIFFS